MVICRIWLHPSLPQSPVTEAQGEERAMTFPIRIFLLCSVFLAAMRAPVFYAH
jgi:hypothetical protein